MSTLHTVSAGNIYAQQSAAKSTAVVCHLDHNLQMDSFFGDIYSIILLKKGAA
jgi:hypothetical protein